MNFLEGLLRISAEYAACVDVPTDVLETVRVAELLEENEMLQALLNEWLHDGRFLTSNCNEYNSLVERTKAILETEEDNNGREQC